METRAVSVSICSSCGERLNVNGVCAVCLVRAGLSPSPTTEFGPVRRIAFSAISKSSGAKTALFGNWVAAPWG